jgi:flagellar biosynthesis anti-sigma factor FlgM
MKIEGRNPGADALAARALERAQAEAKEAAADAARKSGDRVELSPDAELAGAAIKAATDSPDIRPDVVERMKKALAAGEVGSDSPKLAESLIDRMLDEGHGKHG